jgi:hypothetical protein
MKLTAEQRAKVWAGMADWQRPCECGKNCAYRKNGDCSAWHCVPEEEKIAQILGETEQKAA